MSDLTINESVESVKGVSDKLKFTFETRVEITKWGDGGQCTKVTVDDGVVRFFREGTNEIPRNQQSPVGYSDGELVWLAQDLLNKVQNNMVPRGLAAGVKPLLGRAKGNFTKLQSSLKIFLPDK